MKNLGLRDFLVYLQWSFHTRFLDEQEIYFCKVWQLSHTGNLGRKCSEMTVVYLNLYVHMGQVPRTGKLAKSWHSFFKKSSL